jgi:ferredoxin
MKQKDLHEDLVKFYEFMLGPLPNREGFKAAVKQTVTSEQLTVFFLLPFQGSITVPKLEKKAQKAKISPEKLHELVEQLIPEGFIGSYEKNGEQVYERGSILTMTEMQIRTMEMKGDENASIRLESARFMDMMIEGATGDVPTKTPYYRVISVESAITGKDTAGEIILNAAVPDPRAVMPIDLVSEMIKKEPVIVVAECYCRKAKQILDKGCDHPLETCFYFNELALLQLNAGRARKVTYDEAMDILYDCEEIGLVHNINNAQGHIHSLCNCCACSCGVMKAIRRGATNAGAPSRFIVDYLEDSCVHCGICAEFCPSGALTFSEQRLSVNSEKCIGCGLCVSHCPEDTMRLIQREKIKKIPATVNDMFRMITWEAVIGMVLNKFKRKRAGSASEN